MKAGLNLSICFSGSWKHPWGQAFREMKTFKAHQISKLPLVLKGCVNWARENNVTLVTEEHMRIINDKRSKEKNKK